MDSNLCRVCEKIVYPLDMLRIDERAIHRQCLRCAHCKNTLKLGNYAALNGQFYCKPHFKQLFALKGNYSEGFGERPHKEKWDRVQSNTSSVIATPVSAQAAIPHSFSRTLSRSGSDVRFSREGSTDFSDAGYATLKLKNASSSIQERILKLQSAATSATSNHESPLRTSRKDSFTGGDSKMNGVIQEVQSEIFTTPVQMEATPKSEAPAPQQKTPPNPPVKSPELSAYPKKTSIHITPLNVLQSGDFSGGMSPGNRNRGKSIDASSNMSSPVTFEATTESLEIASPISAQIEAAIQEIPQQKPLVVVKESVPAKKEASQTVSQKSTVAHVSSSVSSSENAPKAVTSLLSTINEAVSPAKTKTKSDSVSSTAGAPVAEKTPAASPSVISKTESSFEKPKASVSASANQPAANNLNKVSTIESALQSASFSDVDTPRSASAKQDSGYSHLSKGAVNGYATIRPNKSSSKLNEPSTPVKTPVTPSGNLCLVCSKTVYPMDQIVVDGKHMHRVCMKCTVCQTTLKLGNYAALDGNYYCKPHFKQLFALKGSYNDITTRSATMKKGALSNLRQQMAFAEETGDKETTN